MATQIKGLKVQTFRGCMHTTIQDWLDAHPSWTIVYMLQSGGGMEDVLRIFYTEN